MAIDRPGICIVTELKEKLPTVLEKNVGWLYEDLQSIGQDDRNVLEGALTTKEQIQRLLDILHGKGEAACGEFLTHLQKMMPSFPELAGLSQFLRDYRRKTFSDLLTQLKLQNDEKSKLKWSNILCIGREDLEHDKPKTMEDLPFHFLRKLIALDVTSRNTSIEEDSFIAKSDAEDDPSEFTDLEVEHLPRSIHPLDIQCALLHCSDSYLQQDIVTKLSVCQFAVPLMLPSCDGSHCTLMLWAMRDIVKKWRPQSLAKSKGFKEDNVVSVPIPIFSFVRLGESKLSKSKVLNSVLNPVQQHNDFFIHDDMEGGHLERKISDGLVEISWYFPCGKLDVFPEPIAVTNLRGDLKFSWNQFRFLARISSAVFVFIESICERDFRLLSSCGNPDTRYYFIVTGKENDSVTQQYLNELKPILHLDKTHIIKKTKDAELVKNIRTCIQQLRDNKKVPLETMSKEAGQFAILLDEDSPECQKAEEYARNITAAIGNVEEFKKEVLKLQGDLWKELSAIEKERCRMKRQGGKDTQEYLSELELQIHSKRTEQKESSPHDSILSFINAITALNRKERKFFLKWTKLLLDSISRKNIFSLQEKYPDLNKEEQKQLDERISKSSLGIEHLFREIGQMYEAERYVSGRTGEERKFIGLPGVVADILMEGFPLELIDGDASNIPLMWITDVLNELDLKTGKQSRIRVISVLGVQSTGKSTLLNTMFGLQFPVASGRCTRGAFMTLLNVKENFQEELGCEFILVIDTEGLKAPELASLEDSYEHDNELATLVIGLSDITIVIMAMENTTEMKDVLQIVVHAFLRMKEVGKRPNCQFVHQNVSDVSAHQNTKGSRQTFLNLLDNMTEVAAKMEKKTSIKTFGDVMDYHFEKNHWYIPTIFQGVPPMASVNIGYSEHICELKKFLFQFLKTQNASHTPFSIAEFKVWMENLTTAVKHEKFIFSFKNSLVADAYNKLCLQFSEWEWQLNKKVHNWLTSIKTQIKNQSADSADTETCDQYQRELQILLLEEQKNMSESLAQYYQNQGKNANLLEEFRERFDINISLLIQNHERNALVACEQAVSIQKRKSEIQKIQNKYQTLIEDKIKELLQTGSQEVSDGELLEEFEAMWETTMSHLHFEKLTRRDVSAAILHELNQDMKNKGPVVQEPLFRINMSQHADLFEIKDTKYIDLSTTDNEEHEELNKLNAFSHFLIDRCRKYVAEKVSSSEDYTDTYCKDLLHMINEKLGDMNLNFTSIFELDVKLHILSNAAQEFKKMHEKFLEDNDPKAYLTGQKPQYFSMFQTIFREKDEESRIKLFFRSYLEPAIVDYTFEHLGEKIIEDIVSVPGKHIFASRSIFQFAVLESLLVEMSFQKYFDYVNSHEEFLMNWISQYISESYQDPTTLGGFVEDIFSAIDKKIKDVLTDETFLQSDDVGRCLETFFSMLQRELYIHKNGLKLITFRSNTTAQQFSQNIRSLLEERREVMLSAIRSGSGSALYRASLMIQEQTLKKVICCGKQCPFCKTPCEDGGTNHQKHFTSTHRPEGLGGLKMHGTDMLATGICTISVASKDTFKNSDTQWKYHKYKKYQTVYPDWEIKPNASTEGNDYWKFIFMTFNKEFAEAYQCKPAELPKTWHQISKEKALMSLCRSYNVPLLLKLQENDNENMEDYLLLHFCPMKHAHIFTFTIPRNLKMAIHL